MTQVIYFATIYIFHRFSNSNRKIQIMEQSKKIFIWSLTVALAGFLFGFDTVVISGADLPLQSLWPFGEFYHGFVIMASAL